jgi:hypothetical protein
MSQSINELYSKEVFLKRKEELSYKGEKICMAKGASAQAIVRPVAHVLAPEPIIGVRPLTAAVVGQRHLYAIKSIK